MIDAVGMRAIKLEMRGYIAGLFAETRGGVHHFAGDRGVVGLQQTPGSRCIAPWCWSRRWFRHAQHARREGLVAVASQDDRQGLESRANVPADTFVQSTWPAANGEIGLHTISPYRTERDVQIAWQMNSSTTIYEKDQP